MRPRLNIVFSIEATSVSDFLIYTKCMCGSSPTLHFFFIKALGAVVCASGGNRDGAILFDPSEPRVGLQGFRLSKLLSLRLGCSGNLSFPFVTPHTIPTLNYTHLSPNDVIFALQIVSSRIPAEMNFAESQCSEETLPSGTLIMFYWERCFALLKS